MQQVQNEISHPGDRVVGIGAALIALALLVMILTGVVA